MKRPTDGSPHIDEQLEHAISRHIPRVFENSKLKIRRLHLRLRIQEKAMQANGVPEKVTMDKSGANKAAIDEINARGETPIIVRQIKYLNNIVEQDHRAVKRLSRPMLNFKSFRAAKCVLAGIELMHMIRKGQFLLEGCIKLSFAEQFYALAGQIRPV